MLIRTFQVNLRGPLQVVTLVEYTAMGHPGIKPDIENIGNLFVLRRIDAEPAEDFLRVPAVHAFLFDNRVATLWRGVSRGATRGHKLFMGRNPLTIQQRPPGNSPSELANTAAINFYVREAGEVTVQISDVAGEVSCEATLDAEATGSKPAGWNQPARNARVFHRCAPP